MIDTVKLRGLLERAKATAHHLSLPGDPSWSLYEAEKASAAKALADAAVAALPALLDTIDAMQWWQDIATAPKDGSYVLLWTDTRADPDQDYIEASEIEHFACAQIGHWEDAVDAPLRQEEAGWRKPLIGAPTHWQPLPAPPIDSSDPTIRHRGRG